MNIRINIVKTDKMVYNIYRGDIMQIIDQINSNSRITKKKSADNYCLCNGVNYNVESIIFESTR